MYLKGSSWRMTRRRPKRSNPFTVIFLILMITAMVYVNEVIVPNTEPLFIATPTVTTSPESYISLAREQFEAGNLVAALDHYETAILTDATNPSVFLEMARVQMFAGLYEEALDSAGNALLLSPNNAQAHALRGWALLNTGDTLEAEAAVTEALALDSNNALAHAVYAEILLESFEFEQAGEESRIALSLERSIETLRARGIVLYNTGNYLEAIQEFQAALAINNNIADLHILVGLNHYALGDYDQAVNEYIRANALNPSDPLPDYLISRTYLIVGQYAKAIQFAEEAVQDDPDDPVLRGNLGEARYQNFEYIEAIPELKIAVDNIPLSSASQTIRFYTIYGFALLKTNQCGLAVPVFQAILAGVPADEVAVFNASEGIRQCQEQIGTVEEPADPEAETTPTAEATAASEGEAP
ncbi:MAG TPA: tetratricopeptide repeat protein [Anaerolineales bacterium]|nr:tetratricopeptide repeat protein [Anaerolineales bacterium]